MPGRTLRWSLLVCCALHSLSGQAAEPLALSFAEAQVRLQEVSDALASSRSQVQNKRDLAEASRSLDLPEVTLDVKHLRFQKSLELPLGSLAPVAESFGIASPLEFELGDWRTRPIVSTVMPIYMGGQINAAQAAAQAKVREADAEFIQTQHTLTLQLVQAYFGQQLAEQVLRVRTDVRAGLQQHLEHAQKLEREGFATRAQQLQAQVARDQAEREFQKARNDVISAQTALAGLLQSDTEIRTHSPLFVIPTPIEPVEYFLGAALNQHPGLARLRAIGDQTRAQVRAEKANWQPQIYFFGQYDLKRNDALITELDWAYGIGLKYTLFSNSDRRRKVGAARSQQQQVEYSLSDAITRLEIGITQTYNALDSARQQYVLLNSSIAQAEENLRLQDLSFREGQATSLDVIDARLSLGKAQIERTLAAYQFDLTLAQLLDISGQTQRFTDYIPRADRIHTP